jgi:uncharacterized protein YbaR (Trm112 family)
MKTRRNLFTNLNYKKIDLTQVGDVFKKEVVLPKPKPIVVCPVCKTTNVKLEERRNDNGIIGPGFRSWVVNSQYHCQECGVLFKPVVK